MLKEYKLLIIAKSARISHCEKKLARLPYVLLWRRLRYDDCQNRSGVSHCTQITTVYNTGGETTVVLC